MIEKSLPKRYPNGTFFVQFVRNTTQNVKFVPLFWTVRHWWTIGAV